MSITITPVARPIPGVLTSLASLCLLFVSVTHAGDKPPDASASFIKIPDAGIPQGIVVRTTENVTNGGWVWLLNQCAAQGITRLDLLVKQDEDNFQSARTGQTLQSGELLVALPDEKTATGWENSDWLREMLARAKEKHIQVWAWWPCFHDSQMAAAFPAAAYTSARGEKFVDLAVPEVQARQEELLAKLISTYPFDGVSLDWVRYNSWEDGAHGPAGAAFARQFDFTWEPGALDNHYSKGRWFEARAKIVANWVSQTTQAMRQRHPEIKWGAFVLPPQFAEVSQSYPLLGRAGLDYLQPMGYWTDWKKPPEWVGKEVVAPFSRALTNGTAFWPVLGIDSPAAEIPVALGSLPAEGLGGLSWFTYGTWEQKTFDRLGDLLRTSGAARKMFGYADATKEASSPPPPPAAGTVADSTKRTAAKSFPADSSVWSIICLGELYRRGALAGNNSDPVCPVLAFHTFAEGPIGSPAYLYTCSTGYLDTLFKAIADAGFTVTQLSRLQSFLLTGDAATLPPKPLVLTLDDGSESVAKLFAPRAGQHGFPFTLALVTSWLSETTESNHSNKLAGLSDPTMTWGEAKQLFDSDLAEVVSHSDGLHYMATELPGSDEGAPAETVRQFLVEKDRVETEAEYEGRIRLDMSTSRIKLAEHDIRLPTVFCWPYGEFNQTAKSIARQEGFTHFLLFDTPAVFVSRDSAAEGDLSRVPVLRPDEQVPLVFPQDPVEAQSWWLAFLKVARQSQSRTLLVAALAQLSPENAAHPLAEISRAALEILNGDVAAGSTHLAQLRQALAFDDEALAAVDQTLALYTPRPK